MTAQTEDLIARLEGEARSWESTRADDFSPMPFESLLTEAAQALRSLQAEVDRLRGLACAIADAPQSNNASGQMIAAVASINAYTAEQNAQAILRALNTGSGEG